MCSTKASLTYLLPKDLESLLLHSKEVHKEKFIDQQQGAFCHTVHIGYALVLH